MEAIKKQATKLREQVAKQQQAVLKHLGHFGNEVVVTDEAELQCHRQLQELYSSTKSAKHLQRNIVRGIEGFIATSSKLMEITRKLAEDCHKYGAENQSTRSPLARAALSFGSSHKSMEDERESLLGILGEQVCEPLRTFLTGAPLEDARRLTHRYDKLRQEVEAQAADILKRRSKTRESDISAESYLKLKNAEARLTDLRNTMVALGREATAAMLSVEDQQQKITFQRLLAMVDAERSYHQHVVVTLEKLYSEMILEEQANESSSRSITIQRDVDIPHAQEAIKSNGSNENRPVAATGWSEGECKGKAGWFPSAYIERQEKAPASKLLEADPKP